MNGSLNLYIPLLSAPQRGGYGLPIGLVHHSNQYSLRQQTGVSTTTNTTSGSPTYPLIIDAITYTDSMHRAVTLELRNGSCKQLWCAESAS